MLELLRERRSIRKFTSEPVAPEDIRKLLGAALLAPAGMGKKPLEFIVIRDRETITHLQFLKAHGTAPLASAPLAIVVIADTIKGKGVSFMENTVLWHYRIARGEEYDAALKELEAQKP